MGSVECCNMALEAPVLHKNAMLADFKEAGLHDRDMDYLDVPAFLRRQAPTGFDYLVSSLNARYPETTTVELDIATIAELVALGLDPGVADALLDLISKRVTERDIVAVFLAILSGSDYGKGFSRHVKRLIRVADKQTELSFSVIGIVGGIIESI